ncbi:MAG TPA: hypothetical protein DHW07_03540 [Gammaproteobacteria bacterium]|nr:hypothetical protein [Gammaproteobacteria bacterium]
MSKKYLFATLKIALVGVLFAVIFHNISWEDSYSHLDAQGMVLVENEGKIVGPWDQDRVRFLQTGAAHAIYLLRGTQIDGTTIAISPGLPTYVRNLDIGLFAAGALLFFFFIVVINSRWYFLLRANGLGIRFLEAQKFGWIGLFFNNVMPGATGGDVVKAVYIVRRCAGDKVRAVVSIVVDRILGLISMLFVGSLASALAMNRFPAFASAMWLTGLGVLVFCFLLISPTLRRLLYFDTFVDRLPEKVGNFIRDLDAAVLHYRGHLRGIVGWILASPAIYTLLVGSFFCMSEALGVGITLADLFFIVPVASVIQGIPIAPAGWGIGEAAYGALIGKFGASSLAGVPDAEQIMRTRGVALSVLHRVHVALWSLIGGLAMLIDRKTHPDEPPLAGAKDA